MNPSLLLLLALGLPQGHDSAPAPRRTEAVLSEAGARTEGPLDGVFFLRGVRVWQPDGSLLENRSLLLRNGRIEAAGGPELDPPPEARILEAEEDWVVYPGLLHAAFPATLREAPPNWYVATASDPAAGPVPRMEWGDRAVLRATVRAGALAEWPPKDDAAWREAGFTTAQVLPATGLVRGRASWLALDGQPAAEALLQDAGLLTLGLRSRTGGYPRTPMAALAVLRQAFLDAAAPGPGGRLRPADPDLQELRRDPARPLLFEARSAREIENVLDLLEEFAPARRAVILGGREAWRLADRLREAGAAVLYRLDLPDPPKTDEERGLRPAGERPWWQKPAAEREEERRRHAEQVAAFRRLREAGVPCALVPGDRPEELGKDLKQLEEDGLDRDVLLRALSLDVAAILGLPEAGAVAPGRGADLLVHRGPWDPADPDPAWVFADGRGWFWPREEKENEDRKVPGDGAGGGLGRLLGIWAWEIDAGGAAMDLRLEVAEGDPPAVRFWRAEDPEDRLDAREVAVDAGTLRCTLEPPELGASLEVQLEPRGEDRAALRMETPFGAFAAEARRLEGGGESAGGKTGRGAGGPEAGEGFWPRGHPEPLFEGEEDRLRLTAPGGDLLLRGGTLYPLDGRGVRTGDLLIRNGLIEAVSAPGERLEAPEGVQVLDARGWHLIPGILDAHSHLALDSINEGSVAISAECRIADMIRAGDAGIFRAAAGGTAVAQALHGSANPIGGQAAVWELDLSRRSIRELLLPGAPQGIKFALGENVKRSNGGSPNTSRFPASRAGVRALYRRAFTAARDYIAAREGGGPGFRRDVRLEVLAGILEGRIHIQCHSYRADEILMFLEVCREFGIQAPTFQHVLEGYKVAPELARAGAMASTFSDWWAYKIEAYDAIPWNPALMLRAGVVTSINSDSSEMIRRLNTEAGKSQRYGGLSVEEALSLCTLGPARQLHLDSVLGTLEPGKHATVTVFDGPPLSTYSRCLLTLARGRVLFRHEEAHDRAWEAYTKAVADFAEAHRQPAAHRPRRELDPAPFTAPGRGRTVLIRGATLHPVRRSPFPGDLLARDGRIEFVGESWDGELPEDAQVVEARGLDLYPGFLEAGNRIGLYEIGSLRATQDHTETGDWHPDLSFARAVHPGSAHIRVHRMNGIAYALVQGSSGTIPGQAALIALDGDLWTEMAVAPDLFLQIRFPRARLPEEGQEPERPAALEELDRRFDEALAYAERHERQRAAGVPEEPRDPRLEALAPYARGEKPLLVECRDHATLMQAVQWVEERGLDAVYQTGNDAWKVAGLLGARNLRLITGPVHALPRAGDPYDAPYRNPGILDRAGVPLALRVGNPETARNLPFQAATAAAHGWQRERALRALTLGAAEVLGVDALLGSLDPGKVATFFLAKGDPLDTSGRVLRLWIGGREVELTSKQTELRDRYAARIKAARAGSGKRP